MKYITPEVEVMELDVLDVIHTSSEGSTEAPDHTNKEDALPVG